MGLSWRGMQSLVWRCCGLPQCSTMLLRAAWLLMTPTVQLRLERQASNSLIAATHMLRYATRIVSSAADRQQELAVALWAVVRTWGCWQWDMSRRRHAEHVLSSPEREVQAVKAIA